MVYLAMVAILVAICRPFLMGLADVMFFLYDFLLNKRE